jgi:hypothetical protein
VPVPAAPPDEAHAGGPHHPPVPGVFLWHSPHGHTWLRDPDDPTDLTPDTTEPPREPER